MSGHGQVDEAAFFELRFEPTVALVSTVRRFVSDFYAQVLDPEIADGLGMAAHEMLENAAAYSHDRKSEVTIALRNAGPQVDVTIRTKNRASPERLELVRKALDEVVSAPDPSALYIALMRRSAKRKDGGSGLGLGRIRAEADLSLDYLIEGDLLTLTAHGVFTPPAPRQETARSQEAG